MKKSSLYINYLTGKLDTRPLISLSILALVLELIMELLTRRSFISSISWIALRPHFFLYNTLIVLVPLLVAAFVKRRVFAAVLVSALWLLCGLINLGVLVFRGTPFSARDILLFMSFIPLADLYFTPWQFVGMAILLIALVFAFVKLYRKGPKARAPIRILRSAVFTAAVCSIITGGALASGIDLSADYESTSEAYEACGFVCCFTSSIFHTGIDKPPEYSEEVIEALLTDSPEVSPPAKLPNIIYLQLESFIDPTRIKGVTYEKDPIPNYTALRKQSIAGSLEVPTIGGGTVNTEFEVLTSMSRSCFGIGEYPYESILSETTCESAAYILKGKGLSAHAIHNFSGSFYSRNIVYANLGFDDFTPVEYMYGLEYNSEGWTKDSVLTGCIADALSSTEGRDFVLAVTVQCHGGYPTENGEPLSAVSDDTDLESIGLEELDYYVSQLSETDAFLGELVSMLSDFKEETVLVVYSDHMPGLSLSDEDLTWGNIYETEYLIWSNFGLDGTGGPLNAYRLTPYVFKTIGLEIGIMPSYHNLNCGSSDYTQGLEALEYDMLYGEGIAYGEEGHFAPTDLKMGFTQIRLDSVSVYEDGLTLSGEGFNEYSVVFVNGRRRDTEYVDFNTLYCEAGIEAGDTVTVCQLGSDRALLSESNPVVYSG
ncbi:MAG: sulfatase-like hydrolase/transferase [Clostridiales bacterium]|nr:sulfatase-like hydrolase/transferase [Clostridiales bacterium]